MRNEQQEEADAQAAADAERKRIEDEQKAREQAYPRPTESRSKTLQDELYRESLNAREREELIAMEEFDARVALAGDDEGLIQAATESVLWKNTSHRQPISSSRKMMPTTLKPQKIKLGMKRFNPLEFDMASQGLAAVSASSNSVRLTRRGKTQRRQLQSAKGVEPCKCYGIKYGGSYQRIQDRARKPVYFNQSSVSSDPSGFGGSIWSRSNCNNCTKSIQITRQSTNVGREVGEAVGSAPTPTAPQLDLGFLGGGAGQTGIRTYVVSSEVTNSQQANQRINDQASLVG